MANVGAGHNSRLNRSRSNSSASERGYRFQFALTRRILEGLRRFRTVTVKRMNGDVMTLDNFAQVGRDGGMDMVLEIESASRKSALQTAARVKKVMKSVVE